MATPVFRYPLDPTGMNPDNLVVREPQTLIPKTDPRLVRVFSPIYGPFFSDSIVILDASNGQALTKDDYKVTDLLQDPTLSFGKPIGQFVVITNGSISNNIEVSYQVLGGNYQNNTTAIQHAYETFLNDNRPVDWSNIGNKPSTYPPSLHLHLLQDIINFGPLVVAIDSLRDAKLLNNTPMFEALIQWIKDRQISWSDIIQKPTTAAGFNITDVVTLDTVQTIIAHKTFKTIDVDAGSTIPSTDTGEREVFATSPQVERAEARLVPRTRQILTPEGSGLFGGGNLDGDLTLSIEPSTVVPGTYGSVTKTVALTIDQFGRVKAAGEHPISVSFLELSDVPSTLLGYGITDGVDNWNTQEIRGLKIFEKVDLGKESVAANIHDDKSSAIVTSDYLENKGYVDLTSDQVITGHKDFKTVRLGVLSEAGNIHNFEYSQIVTFDYLTSRHYLTESGINNPINGLKVFYNAVLTGTSRATNFHNSNESAIVTIDYLRDQIGGGGTANKFVTVDNTAQSITGEKSFSKLKALLGSTAADIDGTGFSRIVSDEYMKRYIKSVSGIDRHDGGEWGWIKFTGGGLVITFQWAHGIAMNAPGPQKVYWGVPFKGLFTSWVDTVVNLPGVPSTLMYQTIWFYANYVDIYCQQMGDGSVLSSVHPKVFGIGIV